MGFRENLKEELKYHDIKVKELADKTGIPKRTLDHYLAENSYIPSAENAVKIARALEVSVEYLVTGRDSGIPYSINEKILPLVKKLNHMPEEDLSFFAEILRRLDK